jgi:hypothetical protein
MIEKIVAGVLLWVAVALGGSFATAAAQTGTSAKAGAQ